METFSLYSKNKQALLRSIHIFSADEQKRIQRAVSLAEHYHKNQRRDELETEGVEYVIHCVRTAHWLIEQGVKDSNVIYCFHSSRCFRGHRLASEKNKK